MTKDVVVLFSACALLRCEQNTGKMNWRGVGSGGRVNASDWSTSFELLL